MFFNLSSQPDANKEKLLAFPLTKVIKEKEPAFVDEFEVTYSTVNRDWLTPEEIQAARGQVMLFDVECYQNYFLAGFKLLNGKYIQLESDDNLFSLDTELLAHLLNNFCCVGFNSRNYDILICTLALLGRTPGELFAASLDIIQNEMWLGDFENKYDVKVPKTNHIDLIEVAPLQGSLKLYAGRLHCKRMQDLPYAIDTVLTWQEMNVVRDYNCNDLDNTELLVTELQPALTLRSKMSDQYGIDLRSKSDAQIAEAVIAKELERITGSRPERPHIPVGKTYWYRVPTFINFKTPVLRDLLDVIRNAPLTVSDNGGIEMPESIEGKNVAIGNCIYRIGIGGLHSSEKSTFHLATDNTLLVDRDVVSYYPAIILNEHLFPQHLGRNFLEVYRTLVSRRIEAKKAGNKSVADTLKITINGSFGKLGNRWSLLYSPDLLMQVTITGQLALLLLIEKVELAGIPVVSANTDGVVMACPVERQDVLAAAVAEWERVTGFATEETRYSAVYARDVNNYIAVGVDGKIKTKGAYSERGSAGDSKLSRNPQSFVCNDAVLQFLTKGTPIEDTIRLCKDVTKFVTVRNVKGGAVKSSQYLGRTIRWYQSAKMKGQIEYKLSGNKVPDSDGARPLMELPTKLPEDINYEWYIARANEILVDLGVNQPVEATCTGLLF